MKLFVKTFVALAVVGAFSGCDGDDADAVSPDTTEGQDTSTDVTPDPVDTGGPPADTSPPDPADTDLPIPECLSDADCPPGDYCDQMLQACWPEEAAPCVVSRCEDGIAATCDGEVFADCSAFGASCAQFSDGVDDYAWCDCGNLGAGICQSDAGGIICDQGVIGLPFQCSPGSTCTDDGAIGCLCDNASDGICPDPACSDDPDCGGCTPSCGARVCGDNGCGGSCGECALGESCTAAGACQGCIPDCGTSVCGSNGCGGSCGSCASTESCNADGQCVADCVPSCAGKTCGSNGCGGSCGGCGSGEACTAAGTCEQDCIFEQQTYTFDASALDWSSTNFLTIRARQNRPDGPSTWKSLTIVNGDPTTGSLTFGDACDADVEVERKYSLSGGVECLGGPDTVTTNAIAIPAPSVSGNSCTAPPL